MIIQSAYNNNPNIVGYKIESHSALWHQFRTVGIPNVYEGGIGASEIATVCGKTSPKYGKILPVLMNEKAGITIPKPVINEHAFSGTLAEPAIAHRWRHHDGTELGYLQNMHDKRVIRECREVDAYLVNNTFPWLFASLDRSILANQGGLMRKDQKLNEEHPLELKQLSYFAAQTWESKVPPQYVYQINQQMLICNVEYAELAVLQDGYSFKVYPFELNSLICEEILEKSYTVWQDVLQMRELSQQRTYYKGLGQNDKAEEITAQIDSMIPEPDASEGWKEFLNDRFMADKEEFAGTTQHFLWGVMRQRAQMAIKKLESFVDLIDNKMRKVFTDNQAEVMYFENYGRIKYSRVANRTNPQFNYAGFKAAKEAIDEDEVDTIVKQLTPKLP